MLVYVDKEKLVNMRKGMNLSQRKLSLKSGLPANAVQRMETEDMRVSSLRLSAVAAALGCETTNLIRTYNTD